MEDDEGSATGGLKPPFERILPEDSAEYMIFVLDGPSDEGLAGSSKPLARLIQLRKAALQLSESLTKDYIWQRDGFSLETVSRKGTRSMIPPLAMAFGRCSIGTNMNFIRTALSPRTDKLRGLCGR